MRFLQKNSRMSSCNRFIQHTTPKEFTIVPPTMKGQFDDPEEVFETSITMPFVDAPRLNYLNSNCYPSPKWSRGDAPFSDITFSSSVPATRDLLRKPEKIRIKDSTSFSSVSSSSLSEWDMIEQKIRNVRNKLSSEYKRVEEECLPMAMPSGMEPDRMKDIILGRGGRANHHPANIRLRKMIEKYRSIYEQCVRKDKPLISMIFVNHVRENWKGRFLQQDNTTNEWKEVGDKRAIEKISQLMREKVKPSKRKIVKGNELNLKLLERNRY